MPTLSPNRAALYPCSSNLATYCLADSLALSLAGYCIATKILDI